MRKAKENGLKFSKRIGFPYKPANSLDELEEKLAKNPKIDELSKAFATKKKNESQKELINEYQREPQKILHQFSKGQNYHTCKTITKTEVFKTGYKINENKEKLV